MSEAERKVLLEKRKEVAPKNVIGGSELSKENGVNIQKESLNFCVCGDIIEPNKIVICQWGGEKLCHNPGCAIRYEKKNVCIDCLKKKFPLKKQQYKVLVCVAAGISSVGAIHNLAKVPKKAANEALKDLRKSGYLERPIWSYKITDEGMDIKAAYSGVWDADEDIFILKKEIRNFLGVQ